MKERDMHRQLGNLRRWRRAGHARARTRGAAPAAGRVLGGPHGGNATGGRHLARARPEALRRQGSLPSLISARLRLSTPGGHSAWYPAGALDARGTESLALAPGQVVLLRLGFNLAL